MNWLMVFHRFPGSLFHGSVLRMHRFARRWVQQGDTVALLAPRDDQADDTCWREIGVEILAPAEPTESAAAGRVRFSPYAFNPSLAERAREEALQYDVAIVLNSPGMQYLPEIRNAGRAVMDLVDDPLLELSRRGRSLHPLNMLRRWKTRMGLRGIERACLRPGDPVVLVSPNDAATVARRNPHCDVSVVPIGADTDQYIAPAGMEPFEVPTLTFVGNLSHGANADAAWRIVRGIAPRVERSHPQARFAIVGPNAPTDLAEQAGPNVVVAGRVDDVRPWLWRASGALLPMCSGTGVKTKLLEAWAAATAVIATPLTCQGVPARDGENILLGETDDELAALCVRLVDDADLRSRLGRQGRCDVQRDYDWNHVADLFRARVLGEAPATDRPVQSQVRPWAFATS